MCYDNIYVIWVSLLDNKLFQLLKQKGLKKYVIRKDKAAEMSGDYTHGKRSMWNPASLNTSALTWMTNSRTLIEYVPEKEEKR